MRCQCFGLDLAAALGFELRWGFWCLGWVILDFGGARFSECGCCTGLVCSVVSLRELRYGGGFELLGFRYFGLARYFGFLWFGII